METRSPKKPAAARPFRFPHNGNESRILLNEWFGKRTSGDVIFTFFSLHRKNDPHIGFRAGFLRFVWLKYGAYSSSIERPLMAKRKGANLPYFGKLNDNRAYFPQELKRRKYRDFPVLTGVSGRQKEPKMGLFSPISVIMAFYFHCKRNKNETTKRQRNWGLLPCILFSGRYLLCI
jgi:hypothetical protein